MQEGVNEADHPFAGQLSAQGGFAGGKGDQVGVETQVFEDLPGLEQAVFLFSRTLAEAFRQRQGQGRLEGRGGVDQAVTGEVDDAVARTAGLDSLFGGLASREDLGRGAEETVEGFDLGPGATLRERRSDIG